MEQPLISIIVPVYNVKNYLDYCMQSIYAQSYRNIEIILVDDGSIDGSETMCDNYALQDSRVRVVHKINGGLSSARNEGLKRATGEYITFIDSDDYVHESYIALMLECIHKEQVDIVICGVQKVINEIGFKSILDTNYKSNKLDKDEAKNKLLSRKIPIYAIGKLYRADMAKKAKFIEGKIYEDIPYNWNIFKRVNYVSIIEHKLYFYRQRKDSIVNNPYKHNRMDQLYFSEEILREFVDKNSLYYAAVSRCFFAATDNYSLVTRNFPDDIKELENAMRKYYKDTIKDKNAEMSLKILAICTAISPKIVCVLGKIYKIYKYKQLEILIKRKYP